LTLNVFLSVFPSPAAQDMLFRDAEGYLYLDLYLYTTWQFKLHQRIDRF